MILRKHSQYIYQEIIKKENIIYEDKENDIITKGGDIVINIVINNH